MLSLLRQGYFSQQIEARDAADFLQEARLELRKMIWPTKAETLQTTLIVFAAVIVVALFLWVIDFFLSWFMGLVIH